MVVFSPFVLLLCTLWEPCARFFNKYSAFTDQKKKKKKILTREHSTSNEPAQDTKVLIKKALSLVTEKGMSSKTMQFLFF